MVVILVNMALSLENDSELNIRRIDEYMNVSRMLHDASRTKTRQNALM